jgi:hypothetical protein
MRPRVAIVTGVRTWLVAAALGLALTGCADDPAATPSVETAEESPVQQPTPSEPVPGADSPVVIASVDDLASRLGVETGAVEVVAVQEVTWTDGSKGCAKKGVLYTQSLIEGSRITLQVDGTTYEYHSGGSGPPFLCERPTQ